MKQERQQTGLTLREVARRMGFTAAYISDLELGRRGWNDAKVKAYRIALQCDTSQKSEGES